MKRICVIGANGNVGTALLRALNRDDRVSPVAICRNLAGATQLPEGRHDLRLGSVTDHSRVESLLEGCDVAINCAFAFGTPRESFHTNLAMIQSIAAAHDVRSAVFLSTVTVYGTCADRRRSTFARPKPDEAYGAQKLELEEAATTLFQRARKACTIMRLGHVYGPGQSQSRDIIALLHNPAFRLPFDGARPSNAIHIDDATAVLTELVLNEIEGIYNLTAEPQQSWRELFDWHARVAELERAAPLDETESNTRRARLLRDAHRSKLTRAVADIRGWVRSLPYAQLSMLTAVREGLAHPLSALPRGVQARIKGHSALMAVRAALSAMPASGIVTRPWHFSDEVPGPQLSLPAVRTLKDWRERETHLRQWYAETLPMAIISDGGGRS